MEIKSDISLKGKEWNEALDKYKEIFATRTRYQVYLLSVAIGIKYDERIEKLEETETFSTVPRSVISMHDHGMLDYCFQAAILSTKTEDMEEKERIRLAFTEVNEFDKVKFLTEFGNFGVKKLLEQDGIDKIDTMQNIFNFLIGLVEELSEEDDSCEEYVLNQVDILEEL